MVDHINNGEEGYAVREKLNTVIDRTNTLNGIENQVESNKQNIAKNKTEINNLWSHVGDIEGEIQDLDVSVLDAKIDQEILDRAEGDTALAEQITAGDAALGDQITAGDAALGEQITSVESSLTEAITAGDSALQGQIDTINTDLGNIETPDFTETDPTVPDHVKAITTTDISHWDTAWDEATEANAWGNHADAGYLKEGDIPAGLWSDISSETGNNTIERFGDEVWVTNFKSDDVFIGTKIGNGVETTGDVTAGNAEFSGRVKSKGSASYVKYELHQDSAFTYLAQTPTEFSIQPNGEDSKKFAIDLSSGNAEFSGNVDAGAVSFAGYCGFRTASGTDIVPTDGSGGAISNTIDLGSTSYKYKDAFFSGNVTAADFIATSDERLKKNVCTAPTGVIEKIRGVEFEWKESGQLASGVIAQELEAVPELAHLVHTGEEDGTKHVSYLGLFGYLIEEVKSLRAEIEALK